MKKRIIIIGGGFAGLKLARKLNNTDYDVLLIDQYNFHQFQPLFYQVASARLDSSNISFPLRKVFHKSKNVTIRVSKVLKIFAENKSILTDTGTYIYDYLVIASGADTNYYGNKEIETHALPMKSTIEALNIRMTVLKNFEDVYAAQNPTEKEGLLNYVIVGGGPTGVELAGALIETKKFVLPKDYPDLDFSPMKIYLLEGSPKLLGVMSEKSSQKAREYLEGMGVEVITGAVVKNFDGKIVSLADGKSIRTNTVIWSAGVIGNALDGIPKESIVRGNRVSVNEFHEVVNMQDVFAIGDISHMVADKNYPNGHPQLANVAQSQAASLANVLMKKNRKEINFKPFRYKDKGSMATIGRNKAVVDLPNFHFAGFFAWLVWMFLHLLLIMGMKNRVMVFINWASAYFSKNSSLRILLPKLEKKEVSAGG